MSIRSCAKCEHKRCQHGYDDHYDYCEARDDVDLHVQGDWHDIAADCSQYQLSEECLRAIAREEAAQTWREAWDREIRRMCAKAVQRAVLPLVAQLKRQYADTPGDDG